MKSVVILVQRTILWIISIVLAFFVGILGGLAAAIGIVGWIQSSKDAENEEPEEDHHGVKLTGPRAYSFLYNKTSRNWSEDPEVNLFFLRTNHTHYMDKLKNRGFLFINEVLDGLGLPMTEDGAVYGWLRRSDEPAELWTAVIDEDDKDNIVLKFSYTSIIHNKLTEVRRA